MASPIRFRDDFDAWMLRGLARTSRDPDQLRRLLSLAEIYDGGSRGDAVRIAGGKVVLRPRRKNRRFRGLICQRRSQIKQRSLRYATRL